MSDKNIKPSDYETIRYKDKYRIESARLKGRDYSSNGAYFITICVHDKKCIFGKVVNGEMILSDFGKIVDAEWLKSFEIRSELFCYEYQIMPNHIHAIVVIQNDDMFGKNDTVETHGRASGNNAGSVKTHGHASLHGDGQTHGRASLHRTPKSISSFVGGFKSSVTKTINELRNTPKVPVWQPRFHDHIIRNDDELANIQLYIMHNPLNWESDDYFSIEKEPHRE